MSRLATVAILVATFSAGAFLRDETVSLYRFAAGLIPYRLSVVAQSPPRQPAQSTVGRTATRY